MYFIFRILPIIIMIPLAIYFYFFIKRICLCIFQNINKWHKIICALLAVVFVLPASSFFSFWAVVVLHLFAFAIIMDCIFVIYKKFHMTNQICLKVYQIGVIPILCLFLMLGYGYWNMKNVLKIHYSVTTHKTITQDYRIAFLSDLHFGNTMNKSELEKYCQDISLQKPDIVMLGGDIVDEHTTYQEMKEAFEVLGQIENQYGIYYVYGNHDQALYLNSPHFTPSQLKKSIEEHHISILLDSQVNIQDEMTIIGRQDRSLGEREDTQQLIKNVNHENFILMLDHQPVDLQKNNELHVDLQLSGHTHGGQMFPVGLITSVLGFGEMNYGYQAMSDMTVIVSSGIAGWGYPLRTGSHSEYVIVDIVKE